MKHIQMHENVDLEAFNTFLKRLHDRDSMRDPNNVLDPIWNLPLKKAIRRLR